MKKINNKIVLLLSIMIFSMVTATFFIGAVMATDLKVSEPKSSQTVSLNIIVTDQQVPGVQAVVSDFLASPLGENVSSVTVSSSGTTSNDQYTNIATAMAAGSNTYDVIGMDVVWTAQFASSGWIVPLDDRLVPNELDAYVPSLVSTCTYNGHTYAYPYFMNLGILFYRKDLMDENYGVGMWSESQFSTWEGLNQTANYILNNVSGNLVNPNLVGYIGQFDNYEGGVCNFIEMCGSAGATELVSGTTVNIVNNAGAIKAMTFFQKLVPPQYTGVQGNRFIIPRSALVFDEGSSITLWDQNNSIFMRQWTFGYPNSLDNNIEFGIVPLPHFTGVSNFKTSCIGGANLAIPTFISAQKQHEAFNLIKYLGQTTAQEAELTTVGNFPGLLSVYNTPPTGYEWIANWSDQFAETLIRPKEPQYTLISSVFSNEFSNILSGGKTVSNGLQSMQTNIEQILAGPPEVGIPGYSVGLTILAAGSAIGIMIMLRKRRK
ncbi:MAG: extracellular solute-binding protein [Promethearchaeota archaeon]